MTASIVARRPDAGASTAEGPAKWPGEGDDEGCCRRVATSMHALFGQEVQWNRKGNWAASVEASLWVNAPCPPTADLFASTGMGRGIAASPYPTVTPAPGVDSSEVPSRIIHFA